jgi:single-strand DNA-binding protein
MASFNKVILIGNLVADPELKVTPSGVNVTSFRIAVGRRFNKGEGQQADFIDVVAWRNTAEFVTRYFSKGQPILICGSIQTRNWTDQNGQKRYTVEVVADEASFVERKGNTPTESTPTTENGSQGITEGYNNYTEIPDDSDLPF